MCLKLETVHKFIESKKNELIEYICVTMGRGWHFYHSWLYIKSQEQYTLEQYYYIALYRQQIPAVWHHVTLQNTELTIYQETIQLAQINIKFFQECTYNTDK